MSDFTSLEPILHNYTRSDTIDEGLEGMDLSNQAIVNTVMQYGCREGWLPYINLPYTNLPNITRDWFRLTMLHTEEQEVQYYHSLAWFKARRQITQ